jgi:hypothetical protein
MARILIIGGGCRGRWLSSQLREDGHTARILTRSEDRREEIERAGAECEVGNPDRLGTLVRALDKVAIACWLLGCASGPVEKVQALHDMRLRSFIVKTIDTTVRGILYEANGTLSPLLLSQGAQIAGDLASENKIPLALLQAHPAERDRWRMEAVTAIGGLLSGAPRRTGPLTHGGGDGDQAAAVWRPA